MVEYVFTLDDLGRLRFAISPPWELATSLRALRDPATAGVHVEWVRSMRGRLAGLDLRPALALLGRPDYTPDFMTPPPSRSARLDRGGPRADPRAPRSRACAARSGTCVKRRRAPELDVVPRAPAARAEPPGEGPGRVLGARVRAVLAARARAARSRHRAARSKRRRAGRRGHARRTCTPASAGTPIACAVPVSHNATVPLEGRGLLLVPSAFGWLGPTVITAEPWQPTVIYPARGVALLWEEEAPLDDAIAALLGRTRARVLAASAAPVSTTELARRLEITPSGASQHLSALSAAGLVSRRREGREVLYMRTPLAESLLGA